MKRLLDIKRARAVIGGFGSARVLVIGDLIMDHFIWGKVKRISPEAPVPVVEVESEGLLLGGAANVANNIASLGSAPLLTGVIGGDKDGEDFIKKLTELSIDPAGIVKDGPRRTTKKTRIIAHHQQVVRFDYEELSPLKAATTTKVISYIRGAIKNANVVVVSDYAKGLLTGKLMKEVTSICKEHGRPLVIDPKVEHFALYKGATVVTPNNFEAEEASGMEIKDSKTLKKAGELLKKRLGAEALLITRGEHGMSLFENGSETHIPTVAKEVFDVSGAGDTVIGVFALALGAGASFKEAATLANFAAGVVVGKIGTATLTQKELTEAVKKGLRTG
jgi:D-beta-D-heptose 7-phosphate kinase/D-beta-D-heptose 1-phosphate adenosyltransferase